ncbi:unnamed protein product [Mycena citricolor]|uniref:Uncharacterized protein n=1 Tax=Mycena citricolor TaxID=2018698 RepID=A0AAD2GX58_9AGAR|nr:unnamed protein product [Mycena citricolor]
MIFLAGIGLLKTGNWSSSESSESEGKVILAFGAVLGLDGVLGPDSSSSSGIALTCFLITILGTSSSVSSSTTGLAFLTILLAFGLLAFGAADLVPVPFFAFFARFASSLSSNSRTSRGSASCIMLAGIHSKISFCSCARLCSGVITSTSSASASFPDSVMPAHGSTSSGRRVFLIPDSASRTSWPGRTSTRYSKIPSVEAWLRARVILDMSCSSSSASLSSESIFIDEKCLVINLDGVPSTGGFAFFLGVVGAASLFSSRSKTALRRMRMTAPCQMTVLKRLTMASRYPHSK